MADDVLVDADREDRRNRVLLSFVEAIEDGREPDRGLLLDEHPDLRSELEAFLAGHDEVARLTAPLRVARTLGHRGPIAVAPKEPDEPVAGLGELGDFRLLREVGRGGMGIVYEAEQISLRRRVALKILPFAAAIDPRRLQRFKTEALTAAHVQHEKIVPVHAVGCERGVHYFAMQFIDGQSLAALIAALRGPGDDRRGDPGILQATIGSAESTSAMGGNSAATTISRERTGERRRYFERVGRTGTAGGAGARARASGGDRPSRRQAGQPAAGPSRAALGHRFRPGAGHRRRRAHDHRRAAGHTALRQPRAGASRVAGSSTTAATSIRSARRSTSCSRCGPPSTAAIATP